MCYGWVMQIEHRLIVELIFTPHIFCLIVSIFRATLWGHHTIKSSMHTRLCLLGMCFRFFESRLNGKHEEGIPLAGLLSVWMYLKPLVLWLRRNCPDCPAYTNKHASREILCQLYLHQTSVDIQCCQSVFGHKSNISSCRLFSSSLSLNQSFLWFIF